MRRALALLAFAAVAGPARSDCNNIVDVLWDCTVDVCVVAGPPDFTPSLTLEDGAVMPLELRAVSPGMTLARPQAPLPPGTHEMLWDVTRHITVAGPVATGSQTITGQSSIQRRYSCNDQGPTLRMPYPVVATEEVFTISVTLGRPVRHGARADVWLLAPGDPVPSGNTDAFSVVTPAPDRLRLNNLTEVWVGAEPPNDFSLDVAWKDLSGVERVAVQLVEPTGFISDMLVVQLDTPERYAGCACASEERRGNPWCTVFAMLLALRASRRLVPGGRGVCRAPMEQRLRTTRPARQSLALHFTDA